MRWIWIDRFLEFQSGKRARAVKNLSLAEEYFADHFPGYPVMPGTLILEGLAQTGGILVGEANDFQEKVILAKIPWARFHREAFAGEQLIYDVELLHLRPEGAAVQGRDPDAASPPGFVLAISAFGNDTFEALVTQYGKNPVDWNGKVLGVVNVRKFRHYILPE